jgi:trans-2,3-dihydro-3-hydroxyanthranilate isomerase
VPRRYVTVDVFTDRIFGGNPLAVVLDAQALTAAQMQSIAAEFNYSETTFVLPPSTPEHSAHVRIFTPRREVPFAGHPNVGTAVVLAREIESKGRPSPERMVFEEAAGLVSISLLRERGGTVGAELEAPQPLTVGTSVSVQDAAECLSLAPSDIVGAAHPPQVASVGLPFLVAELESREALRRAKPLLSAHERILPAVGTDSIFAYVRAESRGDLHARMFSPLDGIVEDPATGSAAAAASALIASIGIEDGSVSWRIEQGVDMGRPSLLLGRTSRLGGQVKSVHIAGHAVPVMEGVLRTLS